MNDEIKNSVNLNATRSFYSIVVKRFLDIFLCSFAMLVLSPLLLVVFVLELIFHGSPAIYKTMRPGKDEKIFKLYKFRSMTNEKDSEGYLLPEKERLTKFGRMLRKTSIDELPELINVIKGDMSIIGPRPLLIEYLPLYSDRHRMRHVIRPGLTCERIIPTTSKTWTWREQLDNDIYYVENVSLITDIRTLIAIVAAIFRGSEYRVNDTRAPFTGDNLDETKSRDEINSVIRFDSISR